MQIGVDMVQRCNYFKDQEEYCSSCGFRSVTFSVSLTHFDCFCLVCRMDSHIILDSVWCTWYIGGNACKWWTFNMFVVTNVFVAVKKSEFVSLMTLAVFVFFLHTWLEKLCSCAKLEIRLAYFMMLPLFLHWRIPSWIMVRLMSLKKSWFSDTFERS